MEDEVKLVVTPKKEIGYYFIRNLWVFLFYLLIFVISLIIKMTMLKTIPEIENSMSNILASVLKNGAIVIALVYIYLTIKMYINTRIIKFEFYDKHVKYVDNFWNRESKTISYDKISEVSMRQPIWDRILKTGTIYLKTPVEHGVGIFMNYIENPDAIDKEVRELINDKIV